MTNEEIRALKTLRKTLMNEGCVTAARILGNYELVLFDWEQTPDLRGQVAFLRIKEGDIWLNRDVDINAASTLIRHEMLHALMKHEQRLCKLLADEMGIDYNKFVEYTSMSDFTPGDEDYIDPMTLSKMLRNPENGGDAFNWAGDFDISNKGYNKKDKDIVRTLKLYDKLSDVTYTMSGLVTEDHHEDWVDMSLEDMFKNLRKERQQAQEDAEDELEGDLIDDETFVDAEGNVYSATDFDDYEIEDEDNNRESEVDRVKRILGGNK